jgi:uncharacterized protein
MTFQPLFLTWTALGIFAQLWLGSLSYAQAPATHSLLWQINGRSKAAPSYLYGTMHTKNKEMFQFCTAVPDAVKSCPGFATELDLDSASMMRASKELLMPEGQSLKKLLPPATYEKANAILKKEMGTGMVLFDRLMPVYVMTLMGQGQLMNGEMRAFLDQYLYQYAKKKQKMRAGLETISEQARIFGGIPIAEQVKSFVEAVDKFESGKAQQAADEKRLTELYLQGNIEGMAGLVDDSEIPEALRKQLLDDRNKTMAQRIDSLHGLRNTFFAVGAAHLGGPSGLIAMLRQRGYTVQPVACPLDGSGFLVMQTELAESTIDQWHRYKNLSGKMEARFPAKPSERMVTRKYFAYESSEQLATLIDTALGVTFVISTAPLPSQLSAQELNQLPQTRLEQLAKDYGIGSASITNSAFHGHGARSLKGTLGSQAEVMATALVYQQELMLIYTIMPPKQPIARQQVTMFWTKATVH